MGADQVASLKLATKYGTGVCLSGQCDSCQTLTLESVDDILGR